MARVDLLEMSLNLRDSIINTLSLEVAL